MLTERLLAAPVVLFGVVLFGVALLAFGLLALAPGDAVTALLGPDATPEAIATLRAAYALDAPAPLRFAAWLGQVGQGELGRSITTGRPVLGVVLGALSASGVLAAAALGPALLLALPAGLTAAVWRGRAWRCRWPSPSRWAARPH